MMAEKTEERIKALEIAINNEARERDFYLKHKERTTNALGKSMFASIASDEDEHYQRILALHKRLIQDGKWPETVPIQGKGTEVKKVLNDFVKSVDTTSKVKTDDLEAVKVAID